MTGAVPVGHRAGARSRRAAAPSGSGTWTTGTSRRIDPRRGEAVATVSLGGQHPDRAAIGSDAVWVAHGRAGVVSRVAPRFAQITTHRGDLTAVRGPERLGRGRRRCSLGRVRRLDARPDPARREPRRRFDAHRSQLVGRRPGRRRGLGRERGRRDRAAVQPVDLRRGARPRDRASAASPSRSPTATAPSGSRTGPTTPSPASTRARMRASSRSPSATGPSPSPSEAARSGWPTRGTAP